MPRLRLASRGSRLALLQAAMAADALRAARPGLGVEVVEVRTEGDERPEPLEVIGGRGVFVKEVDEAVLDGRADAAVHSCKDMPTLLHEGLALAALLPRGPAHDVLLGAPSLAALPPGARVGTGSPRRAAQALRVRPDVVPVPLRGNVPTRVARLDDDCDAVVLAAAGLERLGIARPGAALPLEEFPTAPGQGAIAIVARPGSEAARLAALADDAATRACVEVERAALRALGAGCTTPMGCSAWRDGQGTRVVAEVLARDGKDRARLDRRAPWPPPPALGDELGTALAREEVALRG